MKREEMVAAWWEGLNHVSKEGFYVLVVWLIEPMERGKTVELRWRNSAKKDLIEAKVITEVAGEPEIGVARNPLCDGGGATGAPGEGTGRHAVTVTHRDGRQEVMFPKVSDEQLDAWWRGLKWKAKERLYILWGWFGRLGRIQTVRIRKLADGRLEFCGPRARGMINWLMRAVRELGR